MAYIGKSPDGTGVRSRFYYTQTSGGGTSVSGSSDDGTSLAFSDGAYVDVFLNGVLLVAGTDYNTSTANTIAGLAALANGDVVEVVVYDIFTVADTVSSLNGGTFSGNVVFSGTTTGLDLNGTELVLDADADTSITADTDDQIDFKTGGSDRMVIDSGGNVGIGNTTPGSFFAGSTNLVVGSGSGDEGMTIYSGTSNTGNIKFADGTGSDAAKTAGGIRYDHGNNFMRFDTTDGSERMRISGDTLLVGTTAGISSVGQKIGVSVASGTSTPIVTDVFETVSRYALEFHNPNGRVGNILTNGSSTSFNTSSDHRLKENVADMTGAIDRVKALAPKRFNFIADADTTVDGFLAHEAQAVVPEAVTGTHNEVDDDGNAVMQGIDQSKLVPLLTGALKEAIAKIETLETKVAALEAAE